MTDLASLVIKVDSRTAKSATADLDRLETSSKRVDKSVASMGGSAKRASVDFGGLSRVLGAAAAAAAAVKFTKTADEMTNLESRIRLTLSASEDYAEIQTKLNNIARGSVASLADVGTLYARIAPSVQKLGGSQRESLGIVTALNAALRINGATTAEASSAITQFSQAMQSGILRGEEFNALNENASPLLDRLSKNLGVTRGQLREMAFDGKLTAAVVANNILPSVAELEKTAASMGVTASAAFQDLGDDVRIAVGEINDMTGATSALAGAVNDSAEKLRDFVQALKDGNLSEEQKTAVGFAGAITAIGVAYGGVRGALIALTAAQWAFNVAVRANPLIMGLTVITAGIAAVYGYAKATDAVTDKLAEQKDALASLEALRAKQGGANIALDQRIAALKADIAKKEKAAIDAAIEANLDAIVAEAGKKKAVEESGQAYTELKDAATGAGDEISKAMQKAADDAARAAQQIADAKLALQSALDDQELSAGLGLSSGSLAMLNDPNASPDNIRQLNKIEEQELLAEATKKAGEAALESDRAFEQYLSADFGADLSAGFDAASASLGQFVAGFDNLIAANEAYAKARQEAGKDQQKLDKAELKNAKDQINAYANITGAAKGFFKEGSKGYKALQAAEQTFRAFQIAMSAKELAIKLQSLFAGTSADTAATAVEVANAGQRATADGIAAQAKALGSAPPPANFALLAATTAALVGIGVALSGGGNAGPGFVDNTGTGTVFGDASAQSESVTKSIDLLQDAATLENRISSAMLASLRNIEANIGGLTNLIIRGGVGEDLAAGVNTGFQTNAIGSLFQTVGSSFDPIISALSFGLLDGLGSAIGKLVGGLFGSKTKITGQGLTAVPQALEAILNDGFTLLEFVATQTKKKSFGITTSTKNRIRTSLADPELTNQFSLIFGGFADAISQAAIPLGISTETITSRLNGFVVDIGKIDLKGLSGEKIQEKLTAVFGAQADKLAQAALFGLEDFQKVGEGYFETAIRVSSGIEQATTLLNRLGLTAIDYTEILNTQGDVTAEIIRQSVLLRDASKGIAGGFAEIVENFQGSGDEITDLVLQLRDLQDGLIAAGKAGEYLTTFMIAGAGGVDRLTSGLESYFDDFLTPAEQAAELTRRLGAEFATIGRQLPTNIDDFKALLAGIDLTSESGQKLYGQVIALAPAFVGLQDALKGVSSETEALTDETDALTKELTSAFADLRQAIKDAESDLRSAYNAEASGLNATISQFDRFTASLRDFRESLGLTIASTQGGSLSASRAEFASVANRARLGDTTAMADLPGIGRQFVEASANFSSSREDYVRDLAFAQKAAADAEAVAGRQKSIAELQLDALNLAVGKLIDINASQFSTAALRAELEGVGVVDDALIAAVDRNDDGIISAIEAQQAQLLGANRDSIAAIVSAVNGGAQSTDAVRAALAGKASDATINALIASVDRNADGQISVDEANAAKLVAENQAVQSAVDVVAGKTQSVQQATDNLKQLQSFENKAIADATAAGFGALIQSSANTLSAIDRGTAASDRIATTVAQLVSIQAAQEAERQAAKAAQEAEAERISQIRAIEQNAQLAKEQITTGLNVRQQSTSDLERLQQEAYQLASKYNVFLNAQAGSPKTANDAMFGVGENGLYAERYGQITLNSRSNVAGFKDEFFANGGVYDRIRAEAAALSEAKSQIDPANAQLETLRQQIIALGGVPAFATGGMHSGGLRIVGENGPELEYTGPSRIFNAGQTSSMLDQSDMQNEIAQMRMEMKSAMWSIAKHTEKTSRQLERWDDGDRMNVRVDNDDPVAVQVVA